MDWSPQTDNHRPHYEALSTPNVTASSYVSVMSLGDKDELGLVFVYFMEGVAHAHAQNAPLEWFLSIPGLGVEPRVLGEICWLCITGDWHSWLHSVNLGVRCCFWQGISINNPSGQIKSCGSEISWFLVVLEEWTALHLLYTYTSEKYNGEILGRNIGNGFHGYSHKFWSLDTKPAGLA